MKQIACLYKNKHLSEDSHGIALFYIYTM